MNKNDMNEHDRTHIHELRTEYQEIPVPPEARERLLAGIRQAKAETAGEASISRKPAFTLYPFLKRTGMGAAAAMITITVLTNLNPSMASAMEKLPLIGPIARVVTFRTYENTTNQFEAHIQVPQISGSEIPANQSIQEYADQLIALYEAELQASDGQGNYALESSYQVVTDTDQYLSLRINTTQTMASGAQFVKIFTIYKPTGQVISLKELLEGSEDKLTAVSDHIKEQMVQQMAEDDSKVYFYKSDMPETDFKGLTGDESFYFNHKGQLVIAFDEYQVAPGYMGAVEFTIPGSVSGFGES